MRNHIRTQVQFHGGQFSRDLTKAMTHLIARSAEGEKYKFATQWNVKVVTLKWFTDSIERGMILEETLYHPLLPPEKQGSGAWNRSLPAPKKKESDTESSLGARPRKLRRIASAKLGDQNENIWGDIVGMGFETAEPKPPREKQEPNERKQKGSSAVQIAKSFASETTSALSQPREPAGEPAIDRRNGFLDGCFFLIHGFSSKQTNVLRNHLSFNGAQLVDSLRDFSRPDIPKKGHGLYIIVPYKTPRSSVPSTDDLAFECDVVTDMWLERCLDSKTLVSPESHIANTPIPSFPVKGLSGMNICSTGFSRIDLLHLSKLVTLVGATYNEYLKPTASVLICNGSASSNHEKLRHTHEWGVPVVTVDWLWSSIRQEKKQPYEPYIVQKQSTQGSSKDSETRTGSRPEAKRPSEQTTKEMETRQTIHESPQKVAPSKHTHKQDPKQQRPPTEPPPKTDENGVKSPPAKRKYADQPSETDSSTKFAFDIAVGDLLKNARTTTSRSNPEPTGDHDRIRSRRPRPLLGRAQSNSSARAAEQQKTFSRASSIDTLNEDGCGSVIESIRTDGGIPSFGNSGRFDFEYRENELERGVEGTEDEAPQMTQLNYEDPDAVEMREKFLRHAGKAVKEPVKKQDLAVGEVQDLEATGWGTGRRTRNAKRTTIVEDDDT